MTRHMRMVLLAAVVAACSKSDVSGPGSGTGTSIKGTLVATDGRTGSLALTSPVSAAVGRPGSGSPALAAVIAGVVNLTGTVSLSDGTTATLTGTWDTGSGDLNVSGGGFTFTGTFSSGHLSGGFTGPSITGVFSLQVGTTSSDLTVYCGTYTGLQPEPLPSGGTGQGPDNGTWNLVVGATVVDAIILSDGGDQSVLEGTRSGSTISLAVPGGSASGTLSGASSEFVSGTYTVTGGLSGTFQGSTAVCTATTESTPPIASLTITNPGILSGSSHQFLAYDSALVFATAKDAAGHIVAAPLLTWSYTGPVRSNTAATPLGQKWFVSTGLTGSASVKVTSQNAPGVSATAIVIVQ